ncbi:class Ib ribonucleoside-diphosphate reductase assembly flavoprotein NrdI [uncultured Corynebacterium sp.]|uniref:class Ib ribonucleoside-diphosphate reductase assembly flavoprotein NrdI n=1 Tax=uncultured Corynebacterium sp. TaxID=159447 RepID=UPI0026361C6F|nr:class Ib ribonucleoside-diphosphate reductase assembly flavoprotein NrdI [uncultured Corynebacterium sp.]
MYWSSTGTTGIIGSRLGGIPADQYRGGGFVLMFPSYGSPRTGNHVPRGVKKFLREHGDSLVGVVGFGNTVFGPEFCAGAVKVAERWNVPLVAKVDMAPTGEQVEAIQSFLKN